MSAQSSTAFPPHPIDDRSVDDLLEGAYDLHVHSGPDRRPRRYDALDLARAYSQAGFAGAVVKDHFLPTVGRAHTINRILPRFTAYSTIVLNGSVGGLNPVAVEAAVDAGVNWIIFPTVSNSAYRRYEGAPASPGRAYDDIAVHDEQGRLRPAVLEILEVLAGRDIVLASGHLTPEETLDVFTAASERRIARLVVTHASIAFSRMPIELQKRIASLGGVIEHAYVSCLFREPVPLAAIWDQMQQVGLSSSYLASDLGQQHQPPPLDGWRAALGGLRALGATDDQIRQLIVETPRSLVADLPRFSGTWIPEGWQPAPVVLP